MNQEAMAYLNEALDYIQEYSVKREQVDWSVLREEAYALAANAQNSAETYLAIRIALERLGDHHSFFSEPSHTQFLSHGEFKWLGVHALYPEGVICMVAPGSAAEKAGIQVGDQIERVNSQPVTALTITQFRQAFSGEKLDLMLQTAEQKEQRDVHLEAAISPLWGTPQGRRLEQDIGYLNLPSHGGTLEQDQRYAQTTQDIIREIDQQAAWGWVIDLRGNGGGSMWPMLAGVGPILGEGICAFFVFPEKRTTIQYGKGQAMGENAEEFAEVETPYELQRPMPPVAILTSRYTASSGEFIAIAFRGRPHAHSLGEPTRGLPTSNDYKNLSDGARVILTTSLGADRTGQTYENPLVPDQHIGIDWAKLGTIDDPVLQAALQWLHKEKSL